MPRVGFACRWIDRADQIDGIGPKDECKKYNTGGTTVAWLNRQTQEVAEQKLWDLMVQNCQSIDNLITRVGQLPDIQRMVRISSDMLPVYTEPKWFYFWQKPDVRDYLEKHLSKIGQNARNLDVRLSFHPGQFTVLASENDNIVERSIAEFEYHADVVRYMGYGQKFQDFKINVHISGKRGPDGIKQVLPRLSQEARNCITIENDENSWGVDASLELADHCALVLDVHHHWIRTGEYIQPDDDRVKRIVDSWRGQVPVMHYSVSEQTLIKDHCVNTLPDLDDLKSQGFKKNSLRAHSNFYWNNACNFWAWQFLDTFDIMCESKGKNLSSAQFIEQMRR